MRAAGGALLLRGVDVLGLHCEGRGHLCHGKKPQHERFPWGGRNIHGASETHMNKANIKNGSVRRPYCCKSCRQITRLSDDDVWGKLIRFDHCLNPLLDNRHTLPPKL